VTHLFGHDHEPPHANPAQAPQACDDLFVAAEEAREPQRLGDCCDIFQPFSRSDGKLNFSAEETLLFPAFESATLSGGPTQMNAYEHGQMRRCSISSRPAATAAHKEAYAGVAETLLMLMQQHNMKEENILYPMCDQMLGSQRSPLRQRSRRYWSPRHA